MLEAKDLMIGDYVMVKTIDGKQKIVKVAEIIEEAIFANDDSCYYEETIDSIPLTEDILKANEFINPTKRNNSKPKRLNYSAWYSNDTTITFYGVYTEIEVGTTTCSYLGNIKYVHELQHILRVCGLPDVADKLKLE